MLSSGIFPLCKVGKGGLLNMHGRFSASRISRSTLPSSRLGLRRRSEWGGLSISQSLSQTQTSRELHRTRSQSISPEVFPTLQQVPLGAETSKSMDPCAHSKVTPSLL